MNRSHRLSVDITGHLRLYIKRGQDGGFQGTNKVGWENGIGHSRAKYLRIDMTKKTRKMVSNLVRLLNTFAQHTAKDVSCSTSSHLDSILLDILKKVKPVKI